MKTSKLLRTILFYSILFYSILFYSMNVMGQCYSISKIASVAQCQPGDYVTYTITVDCICTNPIPTSVQVIDHLGPMFNIPSLITNDFILVYNTATQSNELQSANLSFNGVSQVVLTYSIKSGGANLLNSTLFYAGCPEYELNVNNVDLMEYPENANIIAQASAMVLIEQPYVNTTAIFGSIGQVPNSENYINENISFQVLGPPGTDEFVIDHDATWIDCNIWIPSGMSIRVEPGINFTMQNCNIYACDMMWRGIIVETHGNLLLDNCSIRQAESAIIPQNQSNIELLNCTFESNINAVYMPPIFPNIQSVNFFAQECSFDGAGPFLPSYPNQVFVPAAFDPVNMVGGIGFLGLWFNDIAGNIDVQNCSFFNLEEGARLERTNAKFLENNFQYMKNGDYGMIGTERQVGIWGNGMKPQTTNAVAGNYLLTVVGSGLPNEYFKDMYGIAIRGMSADVSHTRMDEIGISLYAEHCNFQKVNFHHNTLVSPNTGIYLWENSMSTSVIAGHNLITTPTWAGLSAADGASNYWTSLQINDNQISLDKGTGIRISNLGNAFVYRNDISIPNTYLNNNYIQGIYLRGAYKSTVSCNYIHGTTLVLPPYTAGSCGIMSQMSDDNILSCNTTDTLNNGFVFNGPCWNNTFAGNTMIEHTFGLWCSPNTTFGEQSPLWEDYGNTFLATSSAPNWLAALHLGSLGNVQACKFYVQSYPNNVFTPNANYLDFFGTAIASANPPCQQSTCTLVMIKPPHTGDIDPTDYQIAEDFLSFPIYDPETRWLGKKHLYGRLLADSTLLDNDSLMNTFYNSMQAQSIADFEAIAHARNNVSRLDSAHNHYADSLQNLISTQLSNLHSLDSACRVSPSAQDSSNRVGIISSLQSTMNVFRTWTGDEQTLRMAQAQTIATQNGQLQVSETYEANEKKINEIYFSLQNSNSLTATQQQEIEAIMYQCPLAGGYAVFRARAMYEHYIDDEIVFDDSSYCAAANMQWRLHSQEIIEDITVYPNPAQDIVNIKYTASYEDAEISLINATGTIVNSYTLPTNTNTYTLSLEGLASGIYIVKVGNKCLKLAVQ